MLLFLFKWNIPLKCTQSWLALTILEKGCGMISSCPSPSPSPKATEFSLLYYFTHCCSRKIDSFLSQGFSAKQTQ